MEPDEEKISYPREILDDLSVIFWEAEAETLELTYVSPQTKKILGYPPERFLENSRLWIERIHPEDQGWAPRYCRRAAEEGRDYTFEYRMIAADGRTVWMREFVHPVVEGGRVKKLRGLMADISEMRTISERLMHSQALRSAVMEATEEGILVVGLDGKILDFNSRFQEMWGIPNEVLKTGEDLHVLDYVEGKLASPEEFRRKVEELDADREAVSVDEIRFKDGSVFERFTAPCRIGETVIGRVWAFRDITERLQTQRDLLRRTEELRLRTEELRKRNEELREVDRRRREFIAMCAHELRTPIATVRASIEAFDKKCIVPEKDRYCRRFREILIRNSRRLAHLADNLLVQGRMDGGRFGIRKTTLSLSTLLADLIAEYETVGIPSHLSLSYENKAGQVTIAGDAARLEQVFVNIIDNALRFAASEVRVTLRRNPTVIEVGIDDDGGRLDHEWCVNFNKRGGEAAEFAPSSGAGWHFGFGLRIARSLVNLHGGTLEAIPPNEDRWNGFRVTFPNSAGH